MERVREQSFCLAAKSSVSRGACKGRPDRNRRRTLLVAVEESKQLVEQHRLERRKLLVPRLALLLEAYAHILNVSLTTSRSLEEAKTERTADEEDPLFDEHLVAEALTVTLVRSARDCQCERRMDLHLVEHDGRCMYDRHGGEQAFGRFLGVRREDGERRDVPGVEVCTRALASQ